MKNILTCGSSANRHIITALKLFGCWCGVLSQGYQNPSGAGTKKNKTEVQRGITPWDATLGDACQCTWGKNNPKHRCTRRRNLEIGRWRLRSDGRQYIVHESAMGNSSEETKAVQHRGIVSRQGISLLLPKPAPRPCFQFWAHRRDGDTLGSRSWERSRRSPGPHGMAGLGLCGMQGCTAPFQPAGQWSMELQEAALAHGCWDESKFVGVQFVTQCWRDRNSLGPLHGHRGADANGVGLPPWPFCLQNTVHS